MICKCTTECAECVEPMEDCINQLEGVITIEPCLKCSPEAIGCYHLNGHCLICKRENNNVNTC